MTKYQVDKDTPRNHKAILMSIQPKWVAKILNGEKTIEIRKRFPKDYAGWVYIYCTKGTYLLKTNKGYILTKKPLVVGNDSEYTSAELFNGKVVARFWCDNVEELFTDENGMSYYTDSIIKDYEVSKLACIDDSEIEEYLNGKIGYAIHISKLEIFEEPKEISEFSSKIEKSCICFNQFVTEGTRKIPLTRAPQSWCYVEV